MLAPQRWSQLAAARAFAGRRAYAGVLRRSVAYGRVPMARSVHTVVEKIKQESDVNDEDGSASSTGVVDVDRSEVLLYFDHIYANVVPKFKFHQYLRFLLPSTKSDDELKTKVLQLAHTEACPLPEGASIIDFIPLKRDGGAFVKFAVPETSSPKEVITTICHNVRKNKELSMTNAFARAQEAVFRSYPSCFQVKGTPWIEDLRRFPSSKLKVIFEGQPLTEEELYVLFRRYGLITEIVPASSSTPHAMVIFTGYRAAICAKNCITGISLNDDKTVLHLRYEPLQRVNHITNFISNHQRIAIPIILALIATVAVLIFDPIRQYFIEEKILHRWSLTSYENNRYVKTLLTPFSKIKSYIWNSYDYIEDKLCQPCNEVISNESNLEHDSGSLGANSLWSERFEKVKQIRLWIYENINTYIIVRGPRGSGKRELVVGESLMGDENLRQKVLYLNCDSVVSARSDNTFIENVASQLGYFPVFSWVNSISQFIDLGVQGITGQKSGLSESKETQIKNMFSLATQAIKKVALNDYNVYRSEVQRRRARQLNRKKQNPSLDIVVETVMKEEEYLQQHPELKPVIVIDKFLPKSDTTNDFFYKMISDWTASLISDNIAHVIVITPDVGSIKLLNDSLPNQVFKTVALSDATKQSSFQYVSNQLKPLNHDHVNMDAIDTCLDPLGGRMLDLQAFIRRVKSGESPKASLSEMITQASEQIATFFLLDNKKTDATSWNTAQVWQIMKHLSVADSIDFNDLTKSPLFKPDSSTLATLSALEKNDLISLVSDKGIISKITTGRPIYKAAFKNLIDDVEIYKCFEINYFNTLIKIENDKISKFEDELAKINFDKSSLKNRFTYLVDKIDLSNEKVLKLEADIAEVKALKRSSSKNSSGILGMFK